MMNDLWKLDTLIVVDQPTAKNNIYPRKAVEKAMRSFKPTRKYHGYLDRNAIERNDKLSHKIRRLFIDENGRFCAKVWCMENEYGEELKNKFINNLPVIGIPIISVPSYIDTGLVDENKKVVVTTIQRIIGIQVEYPDEGNN